MTDTTRDPDAIERELSFAFPAAYMMRTTHQHHVQLSAMADLKANIIITATSIALTLAVGFSADGFRPSLLTLAVFMAGALILAILAVLPKYRRVDTPPDRLPETFNLLFFGHFSALDQERYVEEMRSVISSDQRVFDAQARDLYQLGAYLQSAKFRYLRYAYLLFVSGVIAALVTEIIDLSVG